jgi:hypothetical protein
LIVDDVFQDSYSARIGIDLTLGHCVPLLKAMQGHPEAGNWWAKYVDAQCATPLDLVPVFNKSTIHRHSDASCTSPTLMLRQVGDVICGAAASSNRDSILDGIGSKVTSVRSKKLMTLFYATVIEQCA